MVGSTLAPVSMVSRAPRPPVAPISRPARGVHRRGDSGTGPLRVRRRVTHSERRAGSPAGGWRAYRVVACHWAPVEQYEAALATAPLATKCLTSWAGFTVADAVAQTLSGRANANGSTGNGKNPTSPSSTTPPLDGYGYGYGYDVRRTLRNGLFGLGFYGPVSSAWYGALDAWVLPDAPAGAAAVAAKTALDQALWAPVLITCLFAWDLTRSREGLGEGGAVLGAKLRRDLLPTLYVNWSFWPLFHVLNFRFVPPDDRVLYVNVVQVAYNVFLVWKAAGRSADEENGARGEGEASRGGGGG